MKFSPLELLLVISIAVIVGIVLVVLVKYLIRYAIRFLYKGIIIKHNKTEPTYTKTSLFLCEKRRFFMARTEKGGKVFLVSQAGRSGFFHFKTRRIANGR